MIDLILIAFFSYKNYMLAKNLGDKPWKWAFLTFIVCISFNVTGLSLYSQVAGIDMLHPETIRDYMWEFAICALFGLASGYLGYLLLQKMLLRLYQNREK